MWAALAAASVLLGSTAAPPPARVVFASARTGVSQLYSVQPSGRGLAQLTFGAKDWSDPVPSPDGRFVAALHGRELWVMRADGRGARLLAPDAQDPAWSGDSRRLAYESGFAIWVVSLTGAPPRQVTGGGNDAWPTFSPDGRSLTFLRMGDTGWMLVIRRNGRETFAADGVLGPAAWSPNGKWIAVRDDTGRVVELVRPGGGTRRVVARGTLVPAYRRIAWSPDSRRLAYEDSSGAHLVSTAGGRSRLLVRVETTGVAWSPRGDQIAFSSTAAVGVVTPAGRVRTLLRSGPGEAQAGIGWTAARSGLRYRVPQPVPLLVEVSARELRARVPIRSFTADRDRVAYTLCPQVLGAWRPGDAKEVPLGFDTVAACRPGYPHIDYDLALAGDRLAYLTREGGIQVRWTLMLTTLGRRDAGVTLASGADCCAGDPRQPPVGELLGDGSLLVYGTWSRASPESIWRLDEAPVEIAQDREPLSLDAGRIVTRGADGSLDLLDRDGSLIRTFAVQALGAALAGDDLVVLVQGELRDYSASSVALVRAWPVPDVPSGGRCRRLFCSSVRLTLDDAARGLALYTLDGAVHLLRLRDGVDYTVPGATAAELEDAGLFYAYQGEAPWPGRIRFVPFEELPL